MAELMLERTPIGLSPFDDTTRDQLRAWEQGAVIRVNATKPRNGVNHKRFFKLLQVCVDNMPDLITIDALLELVKIRMGHVETIIDPATGRTHMKTKSINFASMDEPEFRRWYADASKIICQHYLHCSEDELMQYIGLL